jgi:hypothetical protein
MIKAPPGANRRALIMDQAVCLCAQRACATWRLVPEAAAMACQLRPHVAGLHIATGLEQPLNALDSVLNGDAERLDDHAKVAN